jgi:mannonate dehydratase
MRINRRELLEVAGAVAAATALTAPADAASTSTSDRREGPNTPKLCLPARLDDVGIKSIKQLGANYTLGGGRMSFPWQEAEVRDRIDRYKAGGLTLANMMIAGFPNAIYGRPGRDEEIEKVIQSIQAAGRAGLPVMEYNWYVHRAMEGYHAEIGRGGSGYTAFDIDRIKDLPPLPEEGAHTAQSIWENITYFLKAVVPEAEKAGVRLALHPNDPPARISRGSEQIMASLDGWKRLVNIVKSPSNGITFDCGVTREMGEDPVEVCRYFGERDCINHVHFRNVRVRVPSQRYAEVFPDEGDVDLFGVMKELVRQKYPRLLYPEHPRGLDVDKQITPAPSAEPGAGAYAGMIFNFAYARALFQAALASV